MEGQGGKSSACTGQFPKEAGRERRRDGDTRPALTVRGEVELPADGGGRLHITYLHKVKISQGAQSQATKGLISGVCSDRGRAGRGSGWGLAREREGSWACLQ